MKKHALILIAFVSMAACASPAAEAPADFSAAACTTRDFDIYFDEFEADLSPEAREVIEAVETALQGCAIQHVRIIGLAGARGPADANMEVSVRRAEVIAAFLERTTSWPRHAYELRAAGEEGAMTDEGPELMRRRAHLTVTAVAP